MKTRPELFPLALAGALLLSAFSQSAVAAEGDQAPADPSVVDRGKYLVTIAGCNDCHTPVTVGPNGPEPDWTRMLSGHPESLAMPPAMELPEGPWRITVAETLTAWSGPWGVSFTANLTPDRETGLGKWTLRNFVETIRTGRHLGRGRAILPPMPIAMYKHMTDEDLAAIFTYLRSIPAVKNKVPKPLSPGGLEVAENTDP